MAVPKLRFKDSEGREFPEWEEKKLCKCCTINPPSPKLPNTFIYIDLESVKQGRLLAKKIVLAKDAPSRAQRKVIVGDVLFQTVRPYQKNNFIVKTPETIPMIASTGYSVLRCNKNNSVYIYHETQTEKFSRNVQDRCTGGAYPAITGKELGEIKIPLPSLPEQQKIADFLTAYDTMIDTQSQRVEAMRTRKKGLLQKIFSQEIRFKDEQGREYPEWLRATFGNLFLALRKNALSRDTLNYGHGNIKNIHYGDILVGFGATVQSTSPLVPYINADKIPKSYDILQCGDIIIADTAEDETAGKGIEIINDSIPTISGLHTLPYRPQTKFAPGYLGYFLNSPYYHKQLIPLLHGIKVLSVTKAELEKTIISYPTLPEQQKIASFFTAVDKQIEVEEKRLETMKIIKKGLLQQMFI